MMRLLPLWMWITLIIAAKPSTWRWTRTLSVVGVSVQCESTTDHCARLHVAIQRALSEYANLTPKIYPRIIIAPTRFPITGTINMLPMIGHPAYTMLHFSRTGVVDGFDVYLDVDMALSDPVMHILLLHELGHVYCLDHSDDGVDSVMNYIYNASESSFMWLTQSDVVALGVPRTSPNFFARPRSITEQQIKCAL